MKEVKSKDLSEEDIFQMIDHAIEKRWEGLDREVGEKLYGLECTVKSAGLRLADDWGLFFMRPLRVCEDDISLDIQLGMVLLLRLTWQRPYGYSLDPKTMAVDLAPHCIKEEEILRILEKMEKVGLVVKGEEGACKGLYMLSLDVFTERVGKALGFEEEVKEYKKEVRLVRKKVDEIRKKHQE